MANKNITLKDKTVVIQRLAEGFSTREAIKYTNISSNQTAARLAKSESHRITQLRGIYAQKLEANLHTSMNERVLGLSGLMHANKPIIYRGRKRNDIYWRSSGASKDLHHEEMFWVSDWDVRLKTIKYIDSICGITNEKSPQINVIQQLKNN